MIKRPPASIVARIETIATAATGEPVVVRFGEEVHGWRNVGIDLARRRHSTAEGRLLPNRAMAALEGGHHAVDSGAMIVSVPFAVSGSARAGVLWHLTE
jgi:hypothetical protein